MQGEREYFVAMPSLPSMQEYMSEIAPIWENHRLTNHGPILERFRELLEMNLNVKNLSLCSSGHMALSLSIRALRLKEKEKQLVKNEVITTPFTFPSTIEAIVENGLKPVFCDINQDDYTMDCTKIRELVNEHTWAIMPVHAYGNICDVAALDEIAQNFGLRVIYDAAHAFGTIHGGHSIAVYGDVTCFSLHATKSMHSIEGGLAHFKDSEIKECFDSLCNFGIGRDGSYQECGCNSKMSEFHAAMGICNLRRFKNDLKRREQLVDRYLQQFQPLAEAGYVTLNHQYVQYLADQMNEKYEEQNRKNFTYFPILLKDVTGEVYRQTVMEYLEEQKIHTRAYFSPAVNNLSWTSKYEHGNTPVSDLISRQVLCLPLYSSMENADVDYISRQVGKALCRTD